MIESGRLAVVRCDEFTRISLWVKRTLWKAPGEGCRLDVSEVDGDRVKPGAVKTPRGDPLDYGQRHLAVETATSSVSPLAAIVLLTTNSCCVVFFIPDPGF